MADLDQLLADFAAAWEAGRLPDVDDYVERAAPAEQDALADAIAAYLAVAPEPAYDEDTLAALREDPRVEAWAAVAEPLPGLLARLRAKAGFGVRDLAFALAQSLGLAGREARLAGYLEQVEAGTLPAGGLSRRLLGALADALSAPAQQLLDAADAARARPAGGALFRSAPAAPPQKLAADLEVLAAAAAAPAPREWDEVDELFRGGR